MSRGGVNDCSSTAHRVSARLAGATHPSPRKRGVYLAKLLQVVVLGVAAAAHYKDNGFVELASSNTRNGGTGTATSTPAVCSGTAACPTACSIRGTSMA